MRTILVVCGVSAGFYTAWKLEKKLRRGEARVVVVDPVKVPVANRLTSGRSRSRLR